MGPRVSRAKLVQRVPGNARNDLPWIPSLDGPRRVEVTLNTPQYSNLEEVLSFEPPAADEAADRDLEILEREEAERRQRAIDRLWASVHDAQAPEVSLESESDHDTYHD